MMPASFSPRSSRRQSSLLALLLAATLGAVGAEEGLASFRVNGRPVGDREFSIDPQGEVLLPAVLVRELLLGLARPELLDAVSGRERDVSASELSLVGIELRYDPNALILDLRVLPRAALPLDLDGGEGLREPVGGRLVRSEPLSLVLGLGLSLEPAYRPSNLERPLRTDAELDLSPALGFFGFVAEANLQAEWREGFSLSAEQARIVRDFPGAGLRLLAGRLDSRAASFQAAMPLYGLALYREESLPGHKVPAPSFGLLEIERPANLRLELNGAVIRRQRLEPGVYRLSDLPLASGLNDLLIFIEEEGGETRRIELGLPYDGGLLRPGELDWYASGGLDAKGSGEGFGSLSAALGLKGRATLSANLQAGAGSLLGGLGLVWASPFGTLATEEALSWSPASSLGSPDYAGRLSWRLSAPGRPFLPRLGLGFEYRSPGFAAPSPPSPGGNPSSGGGYRLSAQASQALPWRGGLSAAAEARLSDSGSLERLYGSLGLYQALPGSAFLTLSAGLDLDGELEPDPSLSLGLSINPEDRRSLQYRHDFMAAEDSLDLSIPLKKEGGSTLGLRAEGLPAPADGGLREASASYRRSLPALELGLSGGFQAYSSESAEWTAQASLRSSLVLAGGRLAWLANPGEAIVLLAPEERLGGELVELRSRGGSLLAASRGGRTSFGSAIQAYERVGALVETPESPPELSVLRPELALEGSYRGVLVVRAEAARSLTVKGRLLLPGGGPAAGRYGEVYSAEGLFAGAESFTDENGLFYCYGLSPGGYFILWAGGGRTAFDLGPEAEDEMDLGETRLGTAPGPEEER